jgi:hypothetical protein
MVFSGAVQRVECWANSKAASMVESTDNLMVDSMDFLKVERLVVS